MCREIDLLPERFTETDDVLIRVRRILFEERIRTNRFLELFLPLEGRRLIIGIDALQDIVLAVLLDDV